MKKLLLLLLPLIFLFSTNIRAQNEQDEFIVSGKDTIVPLNEGRFIFNDRIYKENSPYFTMAYGAGWNLGHGAIEQNMTLSYHHFIKKTGLAIGYHSSSDNKIWWRSYQKLNDLFLLAGIRHETVRYNFSAFAGPTLAYGSYIKYSEELEQNMAHGFTTLGGVFEGQVTYRLLYDIGIGLSVFSSINKLYQTAGVQLHLFFSTAYVRNY